MTTEEFSNEFDILVDSYRRFKDFDDKSILDSLEFSEYEKSIFLSRAQEEIIQALYNGSPIADSFEKTESVRRQLDALVEQAEYTEGSTTGVITDSFKHVSFTLPEDCWFIVYEQATTATSTETCTSEKNLDVLPITHDEYSVIRKNPFRGPNTRRALRLDIGKLKVELVSTLTLGKYLLRYLAKPTPIVLCNLAADNLEIEGVSIPTECALNESIHRIILERAVQLAINSRVTTSNKQNS